MAVGDIMPSHVVLAAERKAKFGALKLTRTLRSSTTSDPAYGPMRDRAVPARVAGSTMRSKLNFTAAALKGVPSWNFTPWWRRNV
jgi:hypothetical protein